MHERLWSIPGFHMHPHVIPFTVVCLCLTQHLSRVSFEKLPVGLTGYVILMIGIVGMENGFLSHRLESGKKRNNKDKKTLVHCSENCLFILKIHANKFEIPHQNALNVDYIARRPSPAASPAPGGRRRLPVSGRRFPGRCRGSHTSPSRGRRRGCRGSRCPRGG